MRKKVIVSTGLIALSGMIVYGAVTISSRDSEKRVARLNLSRSSDHNISAPEHPHSLGQVEPSAAHKPVTAVPLLTIGDGKRHPNTPVEAMMVSNDGLRTNVINKLLASDGFDSMLAKMDLESDAGSLELTKVYRDSLQTSLKATDSPFSLSRISCGVKICAAVFNGTVQNEDQFSMSIMSSDHKEGAKLYSAVSYMLPDEDPYGLATYRIVFATDARFNKLVVPRY